MHPATRNARVVALIDMDCFYCQVEQREKPELWGKPVAVVQYNQYRGGGIIAVSYEARACGVIRRGMRGDKAKELCPELTICQVPLSKYAEKAELGKYRDASAEVFDVLCNFDGKILVERASIDEAYLDLTAAVDSLEKEEDFSQKFASSCLTLPTTHVANGIDKKDEGYDREKNLKNWLLNACQQDSHQLRLAIGAQIVEEIRAKIKEKTQFHCSAGIASNKIIAKLVCSRHKPKQQTVIAPDFISKLFETTKISDIRGLGGKLGQQLTDRYNVKFMAELAKVDRVDLAEHFPHSAGFIELICQGIDEEPVRPRDKQLSIAVSRNFTGKAALVTVSDVQTWLRNLVNDLCARLATDQVKNKRTAQSLSCGCTQDEQSIRTTFLNSYDNESVFKTAWALLKLFNKSTDDKWFPAVRNIYLSAHHFREGIEKPTKSITSWFLKEAPKNKMKEDESEVGRQKMETDHDEVVLEADTDTDQSFTFQDEDDLQSPCTSEGEEIPKEDEGSSKVEKTVDKKTAVGKEKQRSTLRKDTTERSNESGVPVEEHDLLPASFDSISQSTLEHMPPHIKKELMAYYNRKASSSVCHSGKEKISPNSSKLAKTSKKVRKTTPKKMKPKKPSPKRISEFFGKK